MSSTVESPSSSKYVDYDEFIDYQLRKTRSEIKWTEILTTLAGIFALTLSYLFVFTLLDHWVVEGGFSRSVRSICLLSLATISVVWIVWKIVLPMWKEVHGLYAARMIEDHVPDLKSNLLNLIDLQRSGRASNSSIRSALEKRSALELSHVDMDHVIDRRQLLRIAYLLLAVVVLFCLYALLSPKPISFLRPLTLANIPVATQTRIVEVKPGDVTVLARRPVDVEVTLSDKKPDRVLFHFTTKDQSFVDEQLELTASPEKEGEYQLLFAGENGDGIGQEIQYYITAGDARSETYTIHVQTAPIAEIDRIDYRYPDYMQLESRSQFIGAIDAWEGTEVELSARIGNKIPVKSATLQFVDREQPGGAFEEIPLTVLDNNRITGKWTLKFREDGTYAREYRIVCTSKDGLKDPAPPTYPITIRPDESPEVTLLDPTGDLEKPANAVIPLVFKARDPDFQLRYVTLRAEKDGQELQSYLLFDGEQKAVADRYRWELKPLGLKPGDVVSFFLEARDNKEPFGNRRTTQPLKLTITAPAEPKQVEEQLQQEEADQEPQLQEEKRQAAEENGEREGESSSEQEGNDEGEDSTDEQSGDNSENEGNEKSGETEEPSEEGKKENEGAEKGNSEKPGESSKPSENGDQTSDMPTEGENSESGSDQEGSLKNDGSDDAEVLDKILKDQNEKPQAGETPPQPENTGNENPNPDPNAQSGTGDEGAEQENGSGEEQPGDGTKNETPPQPGKGNGDPKETESDNNAEPTNEGDVPNDGNRENTTDDGTAEKKPGDPNTKGVGEPDKNPDPNATRASDPNNIQRKEGTDPSTVPSNDPKRRDDVPKENTSEKPKQEPKGGEGSGKSPDPTAPNQPEGADQPKPSENDPNSRSKQPQAGEEGASQQTSDGTEGDTGEGDAKPSENPGSTSENPEGKPGGKPGEPGEGRKESAEGQGETAGDTPSDKPGSGESTQSQPAKGEPSETQGTGSSNAPGSTEAKGEPGARQGGNRPGANEAGTGNGPTPKDTREKQNLEHAKQAADLVLKRLEKDLERGEVNDELLDELGWTEDEMRAFADRMRRQLEKDSSELSAEEAARQRQFEEMLKNMSFDPEKDSAVRKNATSTRPTRSISGGQRTVPLEYRDAFEEFTRKLNQKERK